MEPGVAPPAGYGSAGVEERYCYGSIADAAAADDAGKEHFLVLRVAPCSFAYILLRLGAVLLELLEGSGLFSLPSLPDLELPLPFVDFGLPLIDLPLILSRIFYPVAYFTLGRSPGHALVDAYIVDRNTLRRIGPGRKLLRSLFQVAIGPIFIVFDMMSVGLTLVDREQRRSLNDWVAGTLVVTGDVPLAPERISWRQRLEELSRAWRPRPAAAPAR